MCSSDLAARMEAKRERYRHGHAYRRAANIPDWVNSSKQLSAFYAHAAHQKRFLEKYHAQTFASKETPEPDPEAVVPVGVDTSDWEVVPHPLPEVHTQWFFPAIGSAPCRERG